MTTRIEKATKRQNMGALYFILSILVGLGQFVECLSVKDFPSWMCKRNVWDHGSQIKEEAELRFFATYKKKRN